MQDLPFFIQKMVVKSLLKNNQPKPLNNKPPNNAGVYCFFLIIFVSCASVTLPIENQQTSLTKEHLVSMSMQDYADHLGGVKDSFINTPGNKIIKLGFTQKYLQNLSQEILTKNEIFFKRIKQVEVIILDRMEPLHFSLPGGFVFLTSGLILKHIKHESMLASIISFELVRNELLLYPQKTLVPTGFITIERLMALNRLTLEEKMEVHKWAHYLTIRSGYDGEYYLSWLQVQNRNTADFILQVGDPNQINSEESLFKAYLIKNKITEDLTLKKNSSKEFYMFINNLKDNT